MTNIFDRKFITWITALSVAIYLSGLFWLMSAAHCSFIDVVLFSMENIVDNHFLIMVVSAFVFCAGIFLLFLIPGWIFLLMKGKVNDVPEFIGLAFMTSVLSVIIMGSLFKLFSTYDLNRGSLFILLIVFIGTELIFLWKKAPNYFNGNARVVFSFRKAVPYFALLLICLCVVAIFHSTILDSQRFDYDLQENTILAIPLGQQTDLLERVGVVMSLKNHLLPYWDLEYANRFGFVFTDPPLFAFIQNFVILLFGESFSVLRLFSLVFIAVMFFVILACGFKQTYLRFLICGISLSTYLLFFLRDINELIYPLPFLIFLIVISYAYLNREQYGMFLLFSAGATLTKFYGIFFVLAGIGAMIIYYPERRRDCICALKRYAQIIIGCALAIGMIGLITGDLGIYWKNFVIEHFFRLDIFNLLKDYYPELIVNNSIFNFKNAMRFLWWCCEGTAYLCLLLFIFGKEKKENFYSLISVIYIVFVFFSRYHLARYIIPIIPFTAIVVSSKLERWILKRG